MSQTATPQVLYGAEAIADFLGISRKAVYHLVERERIPVSRIGRTIVARPARLLAALDQLEGTAA
jgi:predicted DNA-binding transcriptional regulator AlpA